MKKGKRLLWVDVLRGLTLLSMIGFHGMWDAVFLFGVSAPWYRDLRGYVWQQSICWTFLLLSGFSFRLGRKHLKRGITVFLCGALVTAVTLLLMPEDRVLFGVLTCIGSCMLLMIPLDRLLTAGGRKPLSCRAGICGLLISVALFFITRNVNLGSLGFEGLTFGKLPSGLYRNLLTAYFGFPAKDFYSTDYFSMIPWFFLFCCGYFLPHGGTAESSPDSRSFPDEKSASHGTDAEPEKNSGGTPGSLLPVRALAFLGRHTLPVYMLHQPALMAVFLLLFRK